MKIIPFFLFFYSSTFAATFSIISPCEDKPALIHEYQMTNESNVGDQTVKILTHLNIPFHGTAQGISSIQGSPTGTESIEVINNNHMNAYGWCYSVNGFEHGQYPNEFKVTNQDHILWWYGFATYKAGNWITQCTPSADRRDSQFCKNLNQDL